jgi:hypothetical protein
MATVITYVLAWLQGLALGWFCGLVLGVLIWYKRAQHTYGEDLLLDHLDAVTEWDLEDIEEP